MIVTTLILQGICLVLLWVIVWKVWTIKPISKTPDLETKTFPKPGVVYMDRRHEAKIRENAEVEMDA